MKRFAKEKVKHWIRILLHTQDSAERTSFAFALGVFIAFLPPIPWFHTLFALLLAFLFRLNRVATILGTYVNTPFTLVPLIALEVSVGMMVLGGEESPDLKWRQLQSWQGWKDAILELKPFLAPLLLGSVLLGLIAAAISYMIAYRLILTYHRSLAPLVHRAHGETPPAGPAPADPVAPPGPDSITHGDASSSREALGPRGAGSGHGVA